jgi:hypothetical protein
MQFIANSTTPLGSDTQDVIAFGLSNGAFAYYLRTKRFRPSETMSREPTHEGDVARLELDAEPLDESVHEVEQGGHRHCIVERLIVPSGSGQRFRIGLGHRAR